MPSASQANINRRQRFLKYARNIYADVLRVREFGMRYIFHPTFKHIEIFVQEVAGAHLVSSTFTRTAAVVSETRTAGSVTHSLCPLSLSPPAVLPLTLST